MADDPLALAADNLGKAARSLVDLPALWAAEARQNVAQQSLAALSSPGSQHVLGLRGAAEGQGQLQQAQLTLAQMQAKADWLASPGGQQQAQQQAASAGQSATLAAAVALAQQQARLDYGRSPGGQQQAQQQVIVERQASTLEVRTEAARLRAEADHLKTPQGQAQLAAQGQAQHDLGAAGVARQQAQLDYQASPAGQRQAAAQAALQGTSTLQQTQQAAAQQQAQASWLASPAGRQQAGAQAQAAGQLSTSQMQAEALRLRAEAEHYKTPQGRAQLRAREQAGGELEKARRELDQAQDPLTFGRALKGASDGLGAFRTALNVAQSTLLSLGGAASPTHAATYQSSVDLLMAKVGSHVLPALEEASRTIQGVARMVPSPEKQVGGKPLFEWAFPQVTLGRQVNDLLGFDKAKPDLSFMPQPQISTAEQYHDRLQMAVLQGDDVRTEILREQLANLKNILLAVQKKDGEVIVPYR